MATANELSSTERLLDVIRNGGPAVPAHTPPPPAGHGRLGLERFILSAGDSAGVELTAECLRMVRVRTGRDRTPVIRAACSVPIAPDTAQDRDRLAALLRTELSRFLARPAATPIWTSLSLEDADIRCLTVPKLPQGKLENAVRWTYQRESGTDPVHLLLDFKVLGDISDKGVSKTEVLVCAAPKQKVDDLAALFRAAGHPLTGIVAPAFAVQNLFTSGWQNTGESLACSLHIDFNWSRIDIVRPNGDLIVSRGIKAGINSMVESIKCEADRSAAPSLSLDAGEETTPVLELPAFGADDANRILQQLSTDPVSEGPQAAQILDDEDIFRMVLPAVERLIRQVERTLEHVTLRFSDGPIGQLFLCGPICAYPVLCAHMGTQLGLPLETVQPFTHREKAVQPPEGVAARAIFTTVAGVALSSRQTPLNFLRTRQSIALDRRRKRRVAAFLMLLLAGAVALLALHRQRQHAITRLSDRIQRLTAAIGPAPEGMRTDALMPLVARANQANRDWKKTARNMLPAAVIGELTSLAPPHIRFASIKGTRTPGAETGSPSPGGSLMAPMTVTVDGLVAGPRPELEARLARYILSVKQSPLFGRVMLKHKAPASSGNAPALSFRITLQEETAQ